ncbi:aurora kinase-like [Trichomycterus rosablanca]|uniref:aurora kinase-like n=1 Tax=Trichomycterus rosablanca TaxID=2290929 RepID=UPI002F35D1DF
MAAKTGSLFHLSLKPLQQTLHPQSSQRCGGSVTSIVWMLYFPAVWEKERRATDRPSLMRRFLCSLCLCWPFGRVRSQTSFQDVCGGETEPEGSVDAENQIVMEGYLFRRASNVFKTWNRRWFLIQNNHLMYKKKSGNIMVVIADLRLCTAKHYKSIGRRCCFQVVSPTKIWVLQADSEENREAWIITIQNMVANTDGDRTDDSITSQSNEVVDLSPKQEGSSSSSESRGSQHTERDSLRPRSASGTSAELSLGEIVLESAAVLDSLSDASLASSVESIDGTVGGTSHIEDSPEELSTSTSCSNFIHTAGEKSTTTGKHSVQRGSAPSKECFDSLYGVGKLLGKGGCGSVFAGLRKADGKQVAIKIVLKSGCDRFITIPGEKNGLPVEVALMLMVSEPPCCEHVLELLEWFDMPECYVLILERPARCMDLFEYRRNGSLPERLAQVIMWQVVLAARHCRDRGVLHRDIKEQNLLVSFDTLEVKLIDFGCGDLLKSTPYRRFAGTILYAPPEWIEEGRYHGCAATVWSLGVLLFVLVCGELPFWNEREIAAGHLIFKAGVSKACRHLIRRCLAKDPNERPSLEMMLEHNWFSEILRN